MLRWTHGDQTQCVTGVTARDALTKLKAEVA
jgi:hypothetical protein